MRMSVLIFGLPGAGKTTLAEQVRNNISGFNPVLWINGDDVRNKHQDFDFSREGRIRQAQRIRMLADEAQRDGMVAVCDFVCPYEDTREIIEADISVWVDRIQESRYEDTNKTWETPQDGEYNLRLTEPYDVDQWAKIIADMVYAFIKKDEELGKYVEPDWKALDKKYANQLIEPEQEDV